MGKGKGQLYKSGPKHIISHLTIQITPAKKDIISHFPLIVHWNQHQPALFFLVQPVENLSQGGGRCHRQGAGRGKWRNFYIGHRLAIEYAIYYTYINVYTHICTYHIYVYIYNVHIIYIYTYSMYIYIYILYIHMTASNLTKCISGQMMLRPHYDVLRVPWWELAWGNLSWEMNWECRLHHLRCTMIGMSIFPH